ncbi:flocculation protein FLO11-like [Homarus americanus]|uniref:flocculation protein FLO11-like n=1 Tax=Homarus americanus TaxID=6706 RepID=UPI001C48F059|nr:flocculation protein FLO11-like [Homarus americanus]
MILHANTPAAVLPRANRHPRCAARQHRPRFQWLHASTTHAVHTHQPATLSHSAPPTRIARTPACAVAARTSTARCIGCTQHHHAFASFHAPAATTRVSSASAAATTRSCLHRVLRCPPPTLMHASTTHAVLTHQPHRPRCFLRTNHHTSVSAPAPDAQCFHASTTHAVLHAAPPRCFCTDTTHACAARQPPPAVLHAQHHLLTSTTHAVLRTSTTHAVNRASTATLGCRARHRTLFSARASTTHAVHSPPPTAAALAARASAAHSVIADATPAAVCAHAPPTRAARQPPPTRYSAAAVPPAQCFLHASTARFRAHASTTRCSALNATLFHSRQRRPRCFHASAPPRCAHAPAPPTVLSRQHHPRCYAHAPAPPTLWLRTPAPPTLSFLHQRRHPRKLRTPAAAHAVCAHQHRPRCTAHQPRHALTAQRRPPFLFQHRHAVLHAARMLHRTNATHTSARQHHPRSAATHQHATRLHASTAHAFSAARTSTTHAGAAHANATHAVRTHQHHPRCCCAPAPPRLLLHTQHPPTLCFPCTSTTHAYCLHISATRAFAFNTTHAFILRRTAPPFILLAAPSTTCYFAHAVLHACAATLLLHCSTSATHAVAAPAPPTLVTRTSTATLPHTPAPPRCSHAPAPPTRVSHASTTHAVLPHASLPRFNCAAPPRAVCTPAPPTPQWRRVSPAASFCRIHASCAGSTRICTHQPAATPVLHAPATPPTLLSTGATHFGCAPPPVARISTAHAQAFTRTNLLRCFHAPTTHQYCTHQPHPRAFARTSTTHAVLLPPAPPTRILHAPAPRSQLMLSAAPAPPTLVCAHQHRPRCSAQPAAHAFLRQAPPTLRQLRTQRHPRSGFARLTPPAVFRLTSTTHAVLHAAPPTLFPHASTTHAVMHISTTHACCARSTAHAWLHAVPPTRAARTSTTHAVLTRSTPPTLFSARSEHHHAVSAHQPTTAVLRTPAPPTLFHSASTARAGYAARRRHPRSSARVSTTHVAFHAPTATLCW